MAVCGLREVIKVVGSLEFFRILTKNLSFMLGFVKSERPEVRGWGWEGATQKWKGENVNNDFVERRRGGGKEGAVLL